MSQSGMRRRRVHVEFEQQFDTAGLYRRWTSVRDYAERWSGAADDFERLCHHENLLAVAKLMRQGGRRAAGIDGIPLHQYSLSELARAAEVVSAALLAGTYRRQPVRIHPIVKSDGVGSRELAISVALDAVVSKAVELFIAEPVDCLLLPGCIGYRPGSSLASVFAQLHHQIQLPVIEPTLVQFDIENAFPSINRKRLREHLTDLFSDLRLVDLLDRIVCGHPDDPCTGLRQGDATSPALLNVFLHYGLDVWLQNQPEIQFWGRWSDDVWLIPQDDTDGETILHKVASHLGRQGLRLKRRTGQPGSTRTPGRQTTPKVTHLAQGQSTVLLGLELRNLNQQLSLTVPDDSWEALRQKLRECYRHPDPQTEGLHVLESWITAYGSGLHGHDGTANRILQICSRMGFQLVTSAKIHLWINASVHAWENIRTAIGEEDGVRRPRAPRFSGLSPMSHAVVLAEGDPDVAPFDANVRQGDIISQGGFEARWDRLRQRLRRCQDKVREGRGGASRGRRAPPILMARTAVIPTLPSSTK